MKITTHLMLPALLLASLAFTPTARAGDKDKDKMQQYQQQQQKQQQQWKLQQTQKNLQRQQAPVRRHVPQGTTQWAINQKGRGTLTFRGSRPEGISMASVVLRNFYGHGGGVNPSGTASITMHGSSGPYTMTGNWALVGGFTASLNLVPGGGVPGDRISGTLNMAPPHGNSISSIGLNGTMSGARFSLNFDSH